MGRFQTTIKAHTLWCVECKWAHNINVYAYVLLSGDLVNTTWGAQKAIQLILESILISGQLNHCPVFPDCTLTTSPSSLTYFFFFFVCVNILPKYPPDD